RTFFPRVDNCPETCSNNVDLPIPGSPPINTKDPGTIPPPKTRFNSSKLVLNLGVSTVETSSINLGLTVVPEILTLGCALVELSLFSISSTKLFQEPQLGQRPK